MFGHIIPKLLASFYRGLASLAPVRLKNRNGSVFTDYLMISVAVAGIAFPMMMRFMGGPIVDSLMGQRGKLVSFLAQDRKQTVPNSWFSQEEMANPNVPEPANPSKLSEPDQVQANDPKNPGRMRNVGRLSQPGRVAANDPKNPGRLNEPGQISVGGEGGGGGTAGGGGASASGDGMSPDFFGSGDSGGAKNAKAGTENPNESAYGKGGGRAGSEEGGGGISTGGGGDKVKGGNAKEDNAQKGGTAGEARKQMLEGMAKADEAEQARRKPFDWMLLIKLLVFVLIIFLLILIALGNMRKN